MDECETCIYFEIRKKGSDPGTGECKKNPPRIITNGKEEDFCDLWGYWPVVADNQWCGEYVINNKKITR